MYSEPGTGLALDTRPISNCLLHPKPETRLFQPLAEDILSDEELLDLFRIIKQIIRGRPDAERIAKVVFCIFYSLGDHVKCYRPVHDDTVLFRDDLSPGMPLSAVRVSHNPSCCDASPNAPPSHFQQHEQQKQQQQQSLDTISTSTSNDDEQIYTLGQHWKDLAQRPASASNTSTDIHIDLNHHHAVNDIQKIDLSTTPAAAASANQSIMNNSSLPPYLSTTTTPVSSSTGFMLLDHTLASTSTTSTTINTDNTDHNTPVRLYNNDYRPFFSLHSPAQSFTVPLRLGERRDSSPFDYTQPLEHNSDNSNALSGLCSTTTAPPSLDSFSTTSSTPSSAPSSSTSTLAGTPEYQQLNSMLHGHMTNTRIQVDPSADRVVEPRQRGFYYQYGRIDREPPLLRRFAEQGVLTQASLLRKRKRQSQDTESPYVLSTLPAPVKKPKVPHRNGEFDQRRNDIIQRLRSITISDLELKAARLAPDMTLTIEHADLPSTLQLSSMTPEDAAELLEPALRILTFHSNMKPHMDNGMNQNGIYYNADYYRLYLAFIQFQKVFATLFPQEVVKVRTINSCGGGTSAATDDDGDDDPLAIPLPPSYNDPHVSAMYERDRDRDRNMNMKAYRGWIEPLLTETNWAAFRRNIVVGERMVLLTKVVGQGVLLMTKELSGSKLHLTFTNNEWDEFIGGLYVGKWDDTVTWNDSNNKNGSNGKAYWGNDTSRLVDELKNKFLSDFWFNQDGMPVPPHLRKEAQEKRNQEREQAIQQQRQSYNDGQQRRLAGNDATVSSSSGHTKEPSSPSSMPSSTIDGCPPPTTTITTSPSTTTANDDDATAGMIALSSAIV